MNGALILNRRRDIMEKVDAVLEAFNDDILSAIGGSDFHISYEVPKNYPNKVIVTWEWERLQTTNTQDFIFSVNNTAEDFVNRIKAYLFDLIVTIINL